MLRDSGRCERTAQVCVCVCVCVRACVTNGGRRSAAKEFLKKMAHPESFANQVCVRVCFECVCGRVYACACACAIEAGAGAGMCVHVVGCARSRVRVLVWRLTSSSIC